MSQKKLSMFSSPVHTTFFFGFAAYAWYAMGDDIVFLLQLGKLWGEALLSDPAGTILYILNGSANQ
jgi:hypothetical protein